MPTSTGPMAADLNVDPVHVPWPKIPRLSKRTVVITEKLDGTNAAVVVMPDGRVFAQSRTRLVTPGSDNYGFAAWVAEHEDELREGLGEGVHFGEWYGLGIQRHYNLDEKRLALFDTRRPAESLPACVGQVPALRTCQFDSRVIAETLLWLRCEGSVAVPGFMHPEGIVVYDLQTRSRAKVLCEGDAVHKGQVAA